MLIFIKHIYQVKILRQAFKSNTYFQIVNQVRFIFVSCSNSFFLYTHFDSYLAIYHTIIFFLKIIKKEGFHLGRQILDENF